MKRKMRLSNIYQINGFLHGCKRTNQVEEWIFSSLASFFQYSHSTYWCIHIEFDAYSSTLFRSVFFFLSFSFQRNSIWYIFMLCLFSRLISHKICRVCFLSKSCFLYLNAKELEITCKKGIHRLEIQFFSFHMHSPNWISVCVACFWSHQQIHLDNLDVVYDYTVSFDLHAHFSLKKSVLLHFALENWIMW